MMLADPPAAEASTAQSRLHAAAALEAAGNVAAARMEYLALLAAAPDHLATLTQLGALLFRTGYRGAARSAFARAAERHPDQPEGHVKLAHLLRDEGDLDAARRHYEAALRLSPDLAEAHQGLGNVYFDLSDTVRAELHWGLGYRDRVFAEWPYRGSGEPVRVLLLASVRGGNLPAFPLLDPTIFAVSTVAMEFYATAMKLPPHDIVVNAIGDADLCRPALLAANALLACSRAPAINAPAVVLPTGRIENARRLAAIPGVVAPRIRAWPRAALLEPDAAVALADAGFGWPLLLRAPGFHTGRHFVRVDAPGELTQAAAGLPGAELLVLDYVAPPSEDGLFRKFRVMRVDGVMYPLHLAVSTHWKVHYFTAAMAGNANYRAEEARFLTDMKSFLGPRARAALSDIFDALGLDYAGIDFALTRDRRVVLFEANATMAIIPPGAEPIWDYRRAPIADVVAATVRMLRTRAGVPA
jgi:hypothetical protein